MAEFDRIVRGTLVLPERTVPSGWVAIKGETIAATGTGVVPSASVTDDYGAAYIFPGFIDGQTHATSYKGLPGEITEEYLEFLERAGVQYDERYVW